MNDNSNHMSIDWNVEPNYVLQWMFESRLPRIDYSRWLYRVNLAMQGKPFCNLYQQELASNIEKIDDPNSREKYEKICQSVPEGQSFTLANAIATRANQMASGVDTYEYHVNDPFNIIDGDTEDRLAAKCSQDYIENRLDIMSSTFSRDLTKAGIEAILVKYNEKRDENEIIRINPKNIWFDTLYSSTGRERFRGFSTMISWAKLKKMIKKSGDEINGELRVPDRSIFNEKGEIKQGVQYNNKKIRTLNNLDIYIKDLNKLASSTQIQNGFAKFNEYRHDLRTCYNMNYYHTFATDDEARTNSGYNGDDVELTVMYDLGRGIEFKIINRRYVISANNKSFRRKVKFNINDPRTGEEKITTKDFRGNCPLIFQREDEENNDLAHYPIAPVFKLLDLHDQLCAWRAKRDHVTKILSILRIETNGADAQSLRGVLNIMGVVLDDIQGDVNTLNFAYDYTPIDTQIMYLEQTIKETLNAYNQFDAMQSMGDRASAAESGMAIGAVAQGLSTHQNAIMRLYADIARQCIANRVLYSDRSEFPVIDNGSNSVISLQEMALDAVVSVKSKLAKRASERQTATNALTALGTMRDMITPELTALLIEQALYGQVPRQVARDGIKEEAINPQVLQNNAMAGQNMAQALQQNEQMYMQDPAAFEADNILQNASPEEVDQIIAQMAAAGGQEQAIEPPISDLYEAGGVQALDMQGQEGAMTMNMDAPMSPDAGSDFANPNGY